MNKLILQAIAESSESPQSPESPQPKIEAEETKLAEIPEKKTGGI